MKFFAFIMAILVLALSIMPCADKEIVDNESKAKTVLENLNHQQGDPQQDDCSPFCHCSCCGTFSPNYSITTLSHSLSYQSIARSSFLPADIIEIALPIWQPPQLA